MKTWTAFLHIGMTCLLAGCLNAPIPSPLQDPRQRGPFIATSDFPNPPNVEAAASSDQCAGEPLRAVSAPLPDYPARGWSRGLQGWVIVQFNVMSSGQTSAVRVARGVPGGSFDAEAVRAVERWSFQPLSSDDTYLAGCVVLFEFRMGEVRLR